MVVIANAHHGPLILTRPSIDHTDLLSSNPSVSCRRLLSNINHLLIICSNMTNTNDQWYIEGEKLRICYVLDKVYEQDLIYTFEYITNDELLQSLATNKYTDALLFKTELHNGRMMLLVINKM